MKGFNKSRTLLCIMKLLLERSKVLVNGSIQHIQRQVVFFKLLQ